MTTTAGRPVMRVGAVLVAAALLLGGCGGDEDDKPAPKPAPSQPAVTTRTTVDHVTGRLKPKARKAIIARAGKLVDGWFDAAYVGGDYPRKATSFTSAFPGFTGGAVAAARKNLKLMSNADIGARISGVQPLSKGVRLDVLAMKGWPVGVTARIWLSYRTSGQLVSKQLVRGQLDLTKVKGTWKVFAFTVTKTRRPLGGSGTGKSPSSGSSSKGASS
ncbi:hypothetical protein [Nocardioides sp. KR10-350]|uniref:hypothetical protein n=1 Tax=Nocardioides cheoyonin TaxID=3156615 RepID=UPI0032B31D18